MGAKVAVCPDDSSLPRAQTSHAAADAQEKSRFERLRSSIDFRSRRKADLNKENRNANTGATTHSKKTGIVSASHSSTNKARKAPSSETCVADSFDNAMLDKLTAIPYAVDRNEWLATHVLALFEHVNALCGAVSEQCTPGNCPNMNYPGCTKASWTDERGKRHQFSAPRYIDCVMSYSEAVRNNEAIYPTKYASPFPVDFDQHCRRIIKLLWHCCGHLYARHWDTMHALNLRPQTALVLAHMASIAKLYNLLDQKEMTSLTNTLHLVRPLCLQAPPAKKSGGVVENFSQDDGWSRVPTSKSGSWGGHSAVSTNPGVAQSQTC
ncbi:unnamed protein product [Bursaphelenchus okinawaensis]|uniref:Mob1/phocein family protein n=1 Tax=Bursaphelenchus okinawaensis TaxID=465554 RepID=A0A811KRM2_9BILA|nr:unnamed protein product [Bursaphelenchus okinawaensis]CAG9108262.1 unnamed protein product [Bursaphelenchus okinawaensis]